MLGGQAVRGDKRGLLLSEGIKRIVHCRAGVDRVPWGGRRKGDPGRPRCCTPRKRVLECSLSRENNTGVQGRGKCEGRKGRGPSRDVNNGWRSELLVRHKG